MINVIRIDDFKSFEKYFKIPVYGTTKDVFYEIGPSYEYFDELFKYTDSCKFIVEDLGDISYDTLKVITW